MTGYCTQPEPSNLCIHAEPIKS